MVLRVYDNGNSASANGWISLAVGQLTGGFLAHKVGKVKY